MNKAGIPEDDSWRERLRQGLSASENLAFARFALSRVSRTFALNIRILPLPLQNHVLYAYLYCRMADTLEDDSVLEPSEKIRLLKSFSALFTPAENPDENMYAFSAQLPTAWKTSPEWEHLLLVHASAILTPYLDFPVPVQQIISRCVNEMCEGMADFTAKQEKSGGLNLIESIEDLDRYCYYVAGTVGILLCELFIGHSRHITAEKAKKLREHCVSFGLGLQLTNILKDLHDDKDRNISWLPGELLKSEHLTFQDFLHSPAAKDGRRRIYRILFAKAQKHLEDALEYSCLIPRYNRQLRLFCLWPLFMAIETLALLAESLDALTEGVRLKIPRSKVSSIVGRTQLFWWSNRWIHSEFQKPMRRLENALNANSFTLENT